MKRKVIITIAAVLVIGAGTIYTVGTGYVQFGSPIQGEIDSSISEAADVAAQKSAEEIQASGALQKIEEPGKQMDERSETPQKQKGEITSSSVATTMAVSAPASSAPAPVPQTATAIAFNKATDLTLNIGNTNRRSATTTPTGQPVTYQSGDPNVATVSANGTVTCLAAGKTVITAKSGNATAVYNLTVVAVEASTPAPTSSEKTANADVHDVDTYEYALEVIRLVNEKRESVGLSALKIDSDLMSHAKIRAEELASNYSHTRPNGTVEKSECIVGLRQSPATAFQAWMNSEPHRTAILNENGKFNYKYVGSGCYETADGGLYWDLTFAKGGSTSNGGATSSGGGTTNDVANAIYSINATELSLTAGEGYQLSIDTSGASDDMRVEWSVPSLADSVLSVDDSGYVTTYYREGMTSAKATITVSAKVYSSGKLAKTLHCKIIVTQ